jgi:hypothetical protein
MSGWGNDLLFTEPDRNAGQRRHLPECPVTGKEDGQGTFAAASIRPTIRCRKQRC